MQTAYNSVHSYFDGENFTIINCLFIPELIDENFKNVSDFNALTKLFLLKIDRLKLTENNVGSLEILKCLLSEVMIFTIRHAESVSSISPFTESIIQIIEEKYSEHLTLGEICKELHYSLPYASGKFKSETGLTFTEYVQKMRIAESCRLLTESEMSITDIAYKVGYANIKFFNKIFKEITKTTPREYRKQHLNYNN